MVCWGQDGEWGGEIFEIGSREEGEEWGSVEFGSVEFVIVLGISRGGGRFVSIYGFFLMVLLGGGKGVLCQPSFRFSLEW